MEQEVQPGGGACPGADGCENIAPQATCGPALGSEQLGGVLRWPHQPHQLPVWLLARQLLPAEERDREQSAWGTLARLSCI